MTRYVGLLMLAGLLAGCGNGERKAPVPAKDTTTAPPDTQVMAAPDSAVADSAWPGFTLREPIAVPDRALPTLDGDTLRLGQLQNQVTLVNFWATWCPPCREKTPDLVQLYHDFHDEGLSVVGLAVEEGGLESIRPFAERYDVPYPLALASRKLANQFGGVYGLPTSFIVNREGQIVRRIVGRFPTERMRPLLREMLDSPA